LLKKVRSRDLNRIKLNTGVKKKGEGNHWMTWPLREEKKEL